MATEITLLEHVKYDICGLSKSEINTIIYALNNCNTYSTSQIKAYSKLALHIEKQSAGDADGL